MATYEFVKPSIEVTTKNFYHDNIIETVVVEAETLGKAIEKWADIVENEYGIRISKTARKKYESMYVDDKEGNPKKTGLIFNASTYAVDDDTGGFKKINLKLWTRIRRVKNIW